jgi:hypothetical protein
MNVYEKLQTMRVELQKMNLTKSGKNKFAGYDYYELGDFIPQINELCAKHKVTTLISYTSEQATLVIVNSEKPEERIVLSSPMSTAALKGCHEVQNLGAVETYLRRYLYTMAFEIVEQDALDKTNGKVEHAPQAPRTSYPITIKQKGMLYGLYGKKMGELTEEVKEKIRKLSSKEASAKIEEYLAKPDLELPEKQVDEVATGREDDEEKYSNEGNEEDITPADEMFDKI